MAAAEKQANTAAVAMNATSTMPGFRYSATLMRGPIVSPWQNAAPPRSPYLSTNCTFECAFELASAAEDRYYVSDVTEPVTRLSDARNGMTCVCEQSAAKPFVEGSGSCRRHCQPYGAAHESNHSDPVHRPPKYISATQWCRRMGSTARDCKRYVVFSGSAWSAESKYCSAQRTAGN